MSKKVQGAHTTKQLELPVMVDVNSSAVSASVAASHMDVDESTSNMLKRTNGCGKASSRDQSIYEAMFQNYLRALG